MNKIFDCPIEFLRMTHTLVRDAVFYNLMKDLSVCGQERNILVKKISDKYYEVVDGNKRVAAAYILLWKTIKVELVS